MVATEVALTGMAGTGAACRGTVQAALAATGGGFICSVDRHLSGWHRRGPHRAAQQLRNMATYQHPGKKNSGSTNGGVWRIPEFKLHSARENTADLPT